MNKEYAIVIGGDEDGKAYGNDDSGQEYSNSDITINVPIINKMLQKIWEDYGIS